MLTWPGFAVNGSALPEGKVVIFCCSPPKSSEPVNFVGAGIQSYFGSYVQLLSFPWTYRNIPY
jgi:hypothetical protein